jgi:hypothetical protein
MILFFLFFWKPNFALRYVELWIGRFEWKWTQKGGKCRCDERHVFGLFVGVEHFDRKGGRVHRGFVQKRLLSFMVIIIYYYYYYYLVEESGISSKATSYLSSLWSGSDPNYQSQDGGQPEERRGIDILERNLLNVDTINSTTSAPQTHDNDWGAWDGNADNSAPVKSEDDWGGNYFVCFSFVCFLMIRF